jgi:hypothetical protein
MKSSGEGCDRVITSWKSGIANSGLVALRCETLACLDRSCRILASLLAWDIELTAETTSCHRLIWNEGTEPKDKSTLTPR